MRKVMIEGPAFTNSGYGEHTRLVIRSLKDREDLDLYLNPVNWGQTSWSFEDGAERKLLSELVKKTAQKYRDLPQEQWAQVFDLYIHVGIPNEFNKKGKYCVSVTAGIETNKVSPNWLIKTHQGIDKIIVPSEHSKSTFMNTSYKAMDQSTNREVDLTVNCPISVVPYPVKVYETQDELFELDNDFNFLSIALWGPRKNIENMLRWYVDEFRNEDVGLVLKTGFSRTSKIDRIDMHDKLTNFLEQLGERKCKVYFLHGSLTDEEIHSLYQHSKIKSYITTSHGEGYGLPIFEAAYTGTPVVATDWSGHLDFLSGTIKENNKLKIKKLFAKVDFDLKPISKKVVWQDILVEGSMWAHPKEQSFKKQLRNVYKNYGMYKKWAESLKSQLHETHSEVQILQTMRQEILKDTEVDLNFDTSSGEEVIVL